MCRLPPKRVTGVSAGSRLVHREDRAKRAEGFLRHRLDRQVQSPTDDGCDIPYLVALVRDGMPGRASRSRFEG